MKSTRCIFLFSELKLNEFPSLCDYLHIFQAHPRPVECLRPHPKEPQLPPPPFIPPLPPLPPPPPRVPAPVARCPLSPLTSPIESCEGVITSDATMAAIKQSEEAQEEKAEKSASTEDEEVVDDHEQAKNKSGDKDNSLKNHSWRGCKIMKPR